MQLKNVKQMLSRNLHRKRAMRNINLQKSEENGGKKRRHREKRSMNLVGVILKMESFRTHGQMNKKPSRLAHRNLQNRNQYHFT